MSTKHVKKNQELDELVKQINQPVELKEQSDQNVSSKIKNSRLMKLKLPGRFYEIKLKNRKQTLRIEDFIYKPNLDEELEYKTRHFELKELIPITKEENGKKKKGFELRTTYILHINDLFYTSYLAESKIQFIELLLKNEEYILRELAKKVNNYLVQS